MTRTTQTLIALAAVVAAACGPGAVEISRAPADELGFLPQIVDAGVAAGTGVSLTTDADANPHLAYLTFEPEPEPGEPSFQPDPLAPKLPAVMHAHLTGGVWTRTPVAAERDVGDEDETAIAVDPEGVHHVAWTEGAQLFYTSNAGGSFGEPQLVTRADDVVGIAIALDGSEPLLSFYEPLDDPEGPGALVRVATPAGDGWEVETAAEADASLPMTTALGVTADGPLVAYNAGGSLHVASPSGPGWSSEEVDAGGLGVAMAVRDGVPHMAYYVVTGDVRHAHGAPGAWELSDVGEGGRRPSDDWSASIALDAEGTHLVAWDADGGIASATNASGAFEATPVDGTATAGRPRIGAGPDGAVYLGWHERVERRLVVAISGAEEPLLAGPPMAPQLPGGGGDGGNGGGMPTGPPPCEPDGTSLAIVAPVGGAATGFDTDCLAAPAGEAFTIAFDNQDAGVPHNVAIYETDAATGELFVGEIFPGPEARTYEPDPIETTGNLFFRCDVHPTTMTGTFVVG